MTMDKFFGSTLAALLALAALALGANDMGPQFIHEPPNRVDFSNTTGAVVECSARGSPPPDIIWLKQDGKAVGDVPGLRQVLANGNLVFPPFRAEDYRQDVHAQIYVCMARNSVGTVVSKDVNVRAVVQQFYDTDVNKEYAIRGNAVVLKCQVPSFVADFVTVVSWHTDQGDNFYPGTSDVVQQFYQSEVNNEYVIRGNSAVLKCSIPSFVADFVYVISWQDDSGNMYSLTDPKEVVNQYYEAEVVSEYVIRGNTAVLKCNIPSFVADFVRVDAWVSSESKEFLYSNNYVVNQFYKAEILTEYVIRGNTAVLKCSIPSFVADFVHVESWIDEDGKVLKASDNYVVAQYYVTEAENEYVIRGNAAVMKCKIPSFVADFVVVDAWIADDGKTYSYNDGYSTFVVAQSYEVEADNEYVIRGNSAVMKCEVPSFVSDFVNVEMWQDSQGNTFLPGVDGVVHQFYQTRVIDEFVLRGNTAVLKCLIPSFVADFVQVEAWITDDDGSYEYTSNLESDYVVNQYYEAQVYDVFVIKGNAAVFKCQIPSFVSDHVEIGSWQDTDGNKYTNDAKYVVIQVYAVNVHEEYVLRGNAAVLKCSIPSFVSDFVLVSAWIIDDDKEILPNIDNYVVAQAYAVNVMEEYVLRGNSAILKCHIPSFVTDFVYVSSWITEEADEKKEIFPTTKDYVVSQPYTINVMEENVLRGNSAIMKCHIPSFVTDFVSVSAWIESENGEQSNEIYPTKENDYDSKYLVLPSGELHIRDVGPEDGYKSYQCRTKHRLTGETRLSATKGRLVITEPIGSVLPKFPNKNSISGFSAKSGKNLTLLCPAQAYPVPLFRACV